MKKKLRILSLIVLVISMANCRRTAETKPFSSYWNLQPDRYWIGPDYWANRLQDWKLEGGKAVCINSSMPMRTLHILSRYMSTRPGSLQLEVSSGLIAGSVPDPDTWSGFLLGAGRESLDYRRRSLVHSVPGPGGGLITAALPDGGILVIDNETGIELFRKIAPLRPGIRDPQSVKLALELVPKGEKYNLRLETVDTDTREQICSLDTLIQREGNFGGNLALVCNMGRFWFEHWNISGSKIRSADEQRLGPVIGTQYTLSDGALRLTAQLPPISDSDEQEVVFQVLDAAEGKWNTIAQTQVSLPAYIAKFRIPGWNTELRHDYRVCYQLTGAEGKLVPHYYYGVIMQDPAGREEITLAAFTGNSNSHGNINRGSFNFKEMLWFPHEDLTANVAKHNPDLLFYSGDNVYESRPTPADFSNDLNISLDYLYKWYLFLWAHGELTRNIPTISIPDDHDVYHGNIWGASGAKAPKQPASGIYPEHYENYKGHWQQDQGGYKLSADLVNMIQATQVSHLPEPYDPSPVQQGIGVYYCNINYGGISWAVLEDRKFKSAPSVLLPQYKVINGFSQLDNINGEMLDVPGASLLGERQLSFIRDWAADWKGVDLKVALSQSIFANLSTYPDTFKTDAKTPRLPVLPPGVIPKDYRKARDMDSNGWPQSGRNRALRELRKGFATMIGGDQHLGSVIHHGIDEWEDAGYSFCVPSIANLWPRRWFPPEPGENHSPGMPMYTGRYFDGFGNRVTVHAVSNPYQSNIEPRLLHDRAPGYGIIRLNKQSQDIIFECWPRHTDPDGYNAEQYPGWPVRFNMQDNYSREAIEWLPPIRIEGLSKPPVIQVINEITGEILYTLRIHGFEYRARVFEQGTYTIRVGEPGTAKMQDLPGLVSAETASQETLLVSFR